MYTTYGVMNKAIIDYKCIYIYDNDIHYCYKYQDLLTKQLNGSSIKK